MLLHKFISCFDDKRQRWGLSSSPALTKRMVSLVFPHRKPVAYGIG